MNYTKPKEQLLNEIHSNVHSAISYMFNSSNFGSSVSMTIQDAICDGIKEAFRTMMENTYTDQQFEEDLKRKS